MRNRLASARVCCAALGGALLVACGGGSSGDGPPRPPPPPLPPEEWTTPTAVRVSRPTPFANGCLAVGATATIYANADAEPHVAINPLNSNNLVAAWQQDRLSDGAARGLVTAVSVDGGVTWSPPQPLPYTRCAAGPFDRASDPWLSASGAAVFHAAIAFNGGSFAAGAVSAVVVSRSLDGGFTWGPTIALANDNGALYFNDKETVTADPADARFVYAVWDRLDTADRGPARFARTLDGGASWEPAVTIHDPGAGRQTIGNVIAVDPSGTLFNFFTELQVDPANSARVTGHVAVMSSRDRGRNWSQPVRIGELLAVGTRDPARPNLTVRTGEILGSFAVDPRDGRLLAVWQDSRFSAGQHDGIVLSQSVDHGATWSAPRRVNADPAIPAFVPTLAVLPDGTIGVSYYDFRAAGTETTRPTDYWLAVSADGVGWREARLAGNFDILNAPNARGLFLGDYQGLAGSGRVFNALYARVNNGDLANRSDVFADRIDAASALTISSAPRQSAKPASPWTAEAQARVEQHLALALAQRRERWRAWLETESPSR